MNLKIATYNIHHGLKIEKIIDNIRKLMDANVTVFCLQEMREFMRGVSVLDLCIKSIGDGWEYETFIEPNSYDFGLCLIWRKDMLKKKKIEKLVLPEISTTNIRVLLKMIKKPINRGALIGTFKTQGNLIRISNIHLDCAGQFMQRERQLRALVRHLKIRPVPKIEIICGDFNTIGVEALSKKQEMRITDILGRGFSNAHPKGTPTFRLFQRLDYIFVKNLKVNQAEVLKMKGSDHFPIVADLEII